MLACEREARQGRETEAMKAFFATVRRLLRENQFASSLTAGVLVVILTPFLNRYVSDTSPAKAYIAWAAAFVMGFWREIAMGIIAVAVIRLYILLAGVHLPRRINMKDLVVTVSTPPVTVGMHPVEVWLLKRMREAGTGPFEMEQVYTMLGVERNIGAMPVAAWVIIHNLLALKFVALKKVEANYQGPDPFDFMATFERRQPRMIPQKQTTYLFSLTDRGRYALDNLESIPNEFTTKS
jgi:hypothetical protein